MVFLLVGVICLEGAGFRAGSLGFRGQDARSRVQCLNPEPLTALDPANVIPGLAWFWVPINPKPLNPRRLRVGLMVLRPAGSWDL